ncbi:MAG TPA: XRE family transcriptional regulator, partial [Erwinia persicina]|nr:XRE family transcriptional regulator [Erwinia persicina]
MDSLQHHLANVLRVRRSERGWSLTRAAQETGVSKAMLGQIERAESSPTIATLWKIATGFNLP